MNQLLEQLESIQAIVDTVNPSQIERDPYTVAHNYEIYANGYNPLKQVTSLRDRLIDEIGKEKPVNGYLSADYGYGKTATLIYLWSECQQHQILAVPPFKLKELGDLMTATYGWIKASLAKSNPTLVSEIDKLYSHYGLKSQQEQATEIARKYKVSETKALKIVRDLNTDTTKTDSVLNFWQESVSILQKAGFKGLAIFADECQEFLRTEEGSSARIQILSDLVKGMRALGSTPIALILGMPTTPTESAIAEQAGDIIHRMQEQKVSLQLTDAYHADFPRQLWNFWQEKFLGQNGSPTKLVHPAMMESLGQLCSRKDLSNGPRTAIEVFKRIAHFVAENGKPYSPLDLIQDYLEGRVQLYGTQQHKLNDVINNVGALISVPDYPQGKEAIALLASFPSGVSEAVAKEFGLLESINKLAEDDTFYGEHIIQPTADSFALVNLLQNVRITEVDRILGSFRRSWFGEWNHQQKEQTAMAVFQQDILTLLFPVSRSSQKGNWTWHGGDWQQDRFGCYKFLAGSPDRYNWEFPNRSLTISVGSEKSGLMRFSPPKKTHLDWRFYLSYEQNAENVPQRLTAIAGTAQVDIHLQLDRTFESGYPKAFGLLRKVMVAEQCSACVLLNLSDYIHHWLTKNTDASKAILSQLEHHRQECHSFALRLLLPSSENWEIIGLEGINGAQTKLIESAFYQQCKRLFPSYQSFYSNLCPTILKYKQVLEKVPLAVRRGRQLYQVPKEDFEELFETAGSSLPSFLAIFQQHGLISEFKIAAQKTQTSRVKFASHKLEILIQEYLGSKEGTVNQFKYLEIWKEVQKLGYLQEEFEEAIAWLQLRRYIQCSEGIIRSGVMELDKYELKGQLDELYSRVSSFLEAFQENSLSAAISQLERSEKTLDSLDNYSKDSYSDNDEIILEQVYRTIQDIGDRFQAFETEQRLDLQKQLNIIKVDLENFTAPLQFSKVSQEILGTSGLEARLNDSRKILERQVNKLETDCQTLASSIELEAADILNLQAKLIQCQQFLQENESTKSKLLDLVAGLEEWRIILKRADNLREILPNDSERFIRYEDEFVDLAIQHFSQFGVESFQECDRLSKPLMELEAEIKGERRSRRAEFMAVLNEYEAILSPMISSELSLKDICRFDDEDPQGSLATLKQVFLEKVSHWCDRQKLELEKIERDLSFMAGERGQDVTELLDRTRQLKAELERLSGKVSLEEPISSLELFNEKYRDFQAEVVTLKLDKDENIIPEEQKLLDGIQPGNRGVGLSQIRQHTTLETEQFWELMKTLYQKGHLEITLHQRD